MSQNRLVSILLGILLCLLAAHESLGDTWEDWKPFKGFESEIPNADTKSHVKPIPTSAKSAPPKSAPANNPTPSPKPAAIPPPPVPDFAEEDTKDSGWLTCKPKSAFIGFLILIIIFVLMKNKCRCKPRTFTKAHKSKGHGGYSDYKASREPDLRRTTNQIKNPSFSLENQPYQNYAPKDPPRKPPRCNPSDSMYLRSQEYEKLFPLAFLPHPFNSNSSNYNRPHRPYVNDRDNDYHHQPNSPISQRPMTTFMPKHSTVFVDEPWGRVRLVANEANRNDLNVRMKGRYQQHQQWHQPTTSSPSSPVVIAPPNCNNLCNPYRNNPRLYSAQHNNPSNARSNVPFVTLNNRINGAPRNSLWGNLNANDLRPTAFITAHPPPQSDFKSSFSYHRDPPQAPQRTPSIPTERLQTNRNRVGRADAPAFNAGMPTAAARADIPSPFDIAYTLKDNLTTLTKTKTLVRPGFEVQHPNAPRDANGSRLFNFKAT